MQSALRPCRAFSVTVQADGDRNYIVNDIRLKIWDSEPSINRVVEFLSPAVKQPDVKQIRHLYIAMSLRMCGVKPSAHAHIVAPCCVNTVHSILFLSTLFPAATDPEVRIQFSALPDFL
jgi:hypothetical protein